MARRLGDRDRAAGAAPALPAVAACRGVLGERIFVGEIVLRDREALARYVRPDELSSPSRSRSCTRSGRRARCAVRSTRRSRDSTQSGRLRRGCSRNHDVPRLATRYGGGEDGVRRARAAALLLLALPGAAFLYQDRSSGSKRSPAGDLRRDPIFFRTNGERLGRDGSRPAAVGAGPAGLRVHDGHAVAADPRRVDGARGRTPAWARRIHAVALSRGARAAPGGRARVAREPAGHRSSSSGAQARRRSCAP